MSRRARTLLGALAAAAVLLTGACGGDDDPAVTDSEEAAAAPTVAPQPTVGGGSVEEGTAPAEGAASEEPSVAGEPSVETAPAPGPAPLPEATGGPELAVALEEALGGQVSEVTGITSTIDCPDAAEALTDRYTCVAFPDGGGARQVIVRLVEGGYGYQLAINAPLLEEYLVGQVPEAGSVDCPDNIVGAEGVAFECTLTRADGSTARLRVTQTDAAGNVTQEVLEDPAPSASEG